MTAVESDRAAAARQAIADNPIWYHAIELAPGVVTPGFVDHRPITAKLLPDDLSGQRAIDVGTFDGHWAFSMEQRGAAVTALDLPDFDATSWPPIHRERLLQEAAERNMQLGRGFKLAKELLGSSVERVQVDVQKLEVDDLEGEYDLVFIGAILLHLRDPVGTLERLAAQLKPGGRLIMMEAFSWRAQLRSPRKPMAHFRTLESPFNWWVPNLRLLQAWMLTAGWVDVERHGFLRPPGKKEMRQTYVHFTARKP
ncbi:methyltransferase domain-containing protein [Patulibacter defluvii]|uniref:methyltransferase domain-containing protein n=1 Tax=Patulibacter defluvii TaxID=3095358 RepID=UPI002A76238B|nr:methyltransferase domain-containing protein [Patulibacter sp. DM4]